MPHLAGHCDSLRTDNPSLQGQTRLCLTRGPGQRHSPTFWQRHQVTCTRSWATWAACACSWDLLRAHRSLRVSMGCAPITTSHACSEPMGSRWVVLGHTWCPWESMGCAPLRTSPACMHHMGGSHVWTTVVHRRHLAPMGAAGCQVGGGPFAECRVCLQLRAGPQLL